MTVETDKLSLQAVFPLVECLSRLVRVPHLTYTHNLPKILSTNPRIHVKACADGTKMCTYGIYDDSNRTAVHASLLDLAEKLNQLGIPRNIPLSIGKSVVLNIGGSVLDDFSINGIASLDRTSVKDLGVIFELV